MTMILTAHKDCPTMAPIGAVLAVALLALGGVEAKRQDKVSYSLHVGETCDGHPLSGGLSDLALDECHSISAGGIRFHKHRKNKNGKWLDKANSGMIQCYGTLYNGFGCLPENHVRDIALPKDFEKCNSVHSVDDSSVRFSCLPNPEYNGYPTKKEVNLPVTSYSIAADGKAHPSVHTTLFNATQHVYQTDFDATENDTVIAAAAHADFSDEASLEPRGKHNVKGKWMKHPWTGSLICYKCWTKHSDSYWNFRCHSGNGHKNDIDCGPKPTFLPPPGTLTTVTLAKTITLYTTSTVHLPMEPHSTAALEKRSEHIPVTFQNPWLPGEDVCADAEWEKQGKPNSEIRLQHPKPSEECYDSNYGGAVNVNPDYPHPGMNQAQPTCVQTVFVFNKVIVTHEPGSTVYTVPYPVPATTYALSPSTFMSPTVVLSTVHQQIVQTIPTLITTNVLAPVAISTPTMVVTSVIATLTHAIESTLTLDTPTTIMVPIPTVITTEVLAPMVIASPTVVVTSFLTLTDAIESTISVDTPTIITALIPTVISTNVITTTFTAVPTVIASEVLTTVNLPVPTVITTNVLTSTFLNDVTKVIDSVVTTVTWPITPVVTPITSLVTDIHSIVTDINSVVCSLVTPINPIVTPIDSVINSIVMPVIPVVTPISSLVTDIHSINSVVSSLVTPIDPIVTPIDSVISSLLTPINPITTNVISVITSLVTPTNLIVTPITSVTPVVSVVTSLVTVAPISPVVKPFSPVVKPINSVVSP
ncbi:hypothetical protein BU23DRAFT_203709 [Bimuria novae-zelandiae CBS 107.79]|uniref:Uncharacterized protein n=1 Tax=Bimuria novae-zelandiae CBS 107.79 TaxID=1447943 RepID=A0A6A5V1D6_9PLEO|nr:hypothetical protein BU23DRAFT_203709 [Bimuria novae-zelandiae CBS 107.79]